MPKLIQASENDIRDSYNLISEYHKSVSSFPGEIKAPSLRAFSSYWVGIEGRFIFLLYNESLPIGITLFQILETPKRLELGAIYLEPEYRLGYNAYYLYKKSVSLSKKLGIPLVSEISKENHKSIRVTQALAKKYLKSHPCASFKIEPTNNEKHSITLNHAI